MTLLLSTPVLILELLFDHDELPDHDQEDELVAGSL